jgi:hypothetical protein
MTELLIEKNEPHEAFPYKPPSAQIFEKYPHIFQLNEPLPPRFFKIFFDKLMAISFLLLSAPI